MKLEEVLNTSSGPLIQDPPAAEEGHSSIILDLVVLWKVEVLNPQFMQTLRLLRSESHESPKPKNTKEQKYRGLIAPSKAQGQWRWEPAERKSD